MFLRIRVFFHQFHKISSVSCEVKMYRSVTSRRVACWFELSFGFSFSFDFTSANLNDSNLNGMSTDRIPDVVSDGCFVESSS